MKTTDTKIYEAVRVAMASAEFDAELLNAVATAPTTAVTARTLETARVAMDAVDAIEVALDNAITDAIGEAIDCVIHGSWVRL